MVLLLYICLTTCLYIYVNTYVYVHLWVCVVVFYCLVALVTQPSLSVTSITAGAVYLVFLRRRASIGYHYHHYELGHDISWLTKENDRSWFVNCTYACVVLSHHRVSPSPTTLSSLCSSIFISDQLHCVSWSYPLACLLSVGWLSMTHPFSPQRISYAYTYTLHPLILLSEYSLSSSKYEVMLRCICICIYKGWFES